MKKLPRGLLRSKGNSDVSKTGHTHPAAHHRENFLVYVLENPHLHSITLDASNYVSGFAFDCNSRPLSHLSVYRDNGLIGTFPVDRPSSDISDHVPNVATARNCRFAFDVFIDSNVTSYQLEAVYCDGSTESLAEYEIGEIRSMQSWFNERSQGLKQIPPPDCDLVYLTQGIHDSNAYQKSIIPGIYTLKRYLADCGVALGELGSVLDFGCGTGRLIVGWYLDNLCKNVRGCDINAELIRWARTNLPDSISLDHTGRDPPLPYVSKSLDLILAVSVFTHLSFTCQQSWVEEFKRLLNPGGCVLITLHGEGYVRLTKTKKLKEFLRAGYIEDVSGEEGSNEYAACHGHDFVRKLFDGFEIVGYFPQGNTRNGAALFRVAAFQDVYVLRHRG